jgi:hypothetical protein
MGRLKRGLARWNGTQQRGDPEIFARQAGLTLIAAVAWRGLTKKVRLDTLRSPSPDHDPPLRHRSARSRPYIRR